MSDGQPPHPGWEPKDPTLPTRPATARTTAERRTRDRRTARARPRRRRVLRTLFGLFLLGTLLAAGAFVAGYLLVHIPPANSAALAQSNVYLYRDGTQIARDGEVNRESIRLDRVPLGVRRAVLAAEDRDFYSGRAVDPKAMVRAAWNTLNGKGRQSGSTLTQQYVKNYYLGQEQTVTRKVKEFFIAIRLDREKSKDEILEGYLNTSYFGRNAYGIQAAARAYYGKDAENLDTTEGAYLAALLNAPTAYDIVAHPENRPKVLARWNYVLDGMVKEKWLRPDTRATAAFPVPRTTRTTTGLSGQRGYIVRAVEDHLTGSGAIDAKTLARGGYRITTTLDRTKQDAFVTAVHDQVASRLDPDRNPVDRFVRVGGAAVDPATGHVLALYGGVDYTKQYVNNATRRDYQVGSTFKPFVFTAAVQNGAQTQDGRPITPNTNYDGTDRRPVDGWPGEPYGPANEDHASYGDLTVRAATDLSVNAVYAQMAVDVGPATVRDTAVALGLPATTPDLTASPSIALGPATASVLDLAEAYATLAHHGTHHPYILVRSVSRNGRALHLPAPESTQAVTREAADTTTAILRSVVEGGTGTAALSAGRPAAGKTGTAEEDRAAWFAGYTPDLATVVTLMGQHPETGEQRSLYGALGLPRVDGGGPPAEIWAQFTREALAGSDPEYFELQVGAGSEGIFDPLNPPLPDGPDGRPQDPREQDGQRDHDGPDGQQALGPQHPPRPPLPPRLPAPQGAPDTRTAPGGGTGPADGDTPAPSPGRAGAPPFHGADPAQDTPRPPEVPPAPPAPRPDRQP
ncbi:transglycosylase domain-containing protein [Streptomyces sp. NBC_01216]|uniref:transglycosylase domain-containing protein n=1 Tax=unclassified Streptomyces TaxID=2593676 RepID=UPI002E103C2F|nr:transglycosylase domain-containing protein [Streptomyces sp. NBC_01216]